MYSYDAVCYYFNYETIALIFRNRISHWKVFNDIRYNAHSQALLLGVRWAKFTSELCKLFRNRKRVANPLKWSLIMQWYNHMVQTQMNSELKLNINSFRKFFHTKRDLMGIHQFSEFITMIINSPNYIMIFYFNRFYLIR